MHFNLNFTGKMLNASVVEIHIIYKWKSNYTFLFRFLTITVPYRLKKSYVIKIKADQACKHDLELMNDFSQYS